MTETAEAASPFIEVLGAAFAQLPAVTRQLHGAAPSHWCGEGSVQRGGDLLARLCGWLARLPPASPQVVISLQIQPHADRSQGWTRQFGGARMPSRLRAEHGLLQERLGALSFWFALEVADAAIHWRVRRVRMLGVLPMPARWFAGVQAWSGADAHGRYRFRVEARLPLLGLLVQYTGWLEPSTGLTARSG